MESKNSYLDKLKKGNLTTYVILIGVLIVVGIGAYYLVSLGSVNAFTIARTLNKKILLGGARVR